MLNHNLTINGQRISKEEDMPAFFRNDHFSCVIDGYCPEVEFSPDGNAFIGWLKYHVPITKYQARLRGEPDFVHILSETQHNHRGVYR